MTRCFRETAEPKTLKTTQGTLEAWALRTWHENLANMENASLSQTCVIQDARDIY